MTSVHVTDAEAAAFFDHVRRDPVWFARDVLGIELWSKQREILEAVRDHDRTTVSSAHATGKTAGAAVTALWWLAGGPGSIAVTTSSTDRQLRRILWRELARRYRAAARLTDAFAAAELSDVELYLDDDWYAIGLSTAEPENFAGFHAERVLVIVDEASGVEEDIFEAIDGILAGGAETRLLLIGNPTQPGGQFFRSHRAESKLWRTIEISAFDTPLFTGEEVSAEAARRLVKPAWVEHVRAKYGEGSRFWNVRVLGQFPDVGDDGVIPLSVVVAAQAREAVGPGRAIVAVDVARFGDDETVIVTRVGPRVRVVKTFTGADLMHTVGEVTLVARELGRQAAPGERPLVVVDDAGLGGGVTDRLRQLGDFQVVAFNGAEKARDTDEYANLRAESWFAMRDVLPTLDLDPDELLRDDLIVPRYKFNRSNRLLVESKDELKKRLKRSPDRGDAVVMACSVRPGYSAPRQPPTSRAARDPFDRFMRDRGDGSLRDPGESIAGDILTRPM